jgi:cyclase
MRRLIACLDVRNGTVVKGVQFEELRDAGDPAVLARRYYEEGADEIVILDVTATIERRLPLVDTVSAVARQIFVPLVVGGGIGSMDDASAVFDSGADKVSINSAALNDPALITRLATRYGSQAVVVAIDSKRRGLESERATASEPRERRGDFGGPASERAGGSGGAKPPGLWFEVYARSGRDATGRDAVAWATEASSRGAGELLVTSMDRDGTRAGFDCELTAAMSSAVNIPVIASGGAGEPAHFVDVFKAGRADAALAASILHFAEHSIRSLKSVLAASGVPVRC